MNSLASTVWLTGLSGSGKSTTAEALREYLAGIGRPVIVIDGDGLRSGLSSDLGFSNSDRDENVRRAGEIAILANTQGVVAIVALISPRAEARARVRQRHSDLDLRFFEVHMATPLEVCEARDVKALYRQARAGTLPAMTGVGDPYEPPVSADVVVSTETLTTIEIVHSILEVVNS